ncbi:HECT domain-containing protein [Plasmodiophora brassicae]
MRLLVCVALVAACSKANDDADGRIVLRCFASAGRGDMTSLRQLLGSMCLETRRRAVIGSIQAACISGRRDVVGALLDDEVQALRIDPNMLLTAEWLARVVGNHTDVAHDVYQYVVTRYGPVPVDTPLVIGADLADWLRTLLCRSSCHSDDRQDASTSVVQSLPGYSQPRRRLRIHPVSGEEPSLTPVSQVDVEVIRPASPDALSDTDSICWQTPPPPAPTPSPPDTYIGVSSDDEYDFATDVDSSLELLFDSEIKQPWGYTVSGQTSQEQGEQFLETLNAYFVSPEWSDQFNLRRRFFVRTRPGNVAIDEGGLTATLFQSALTVLLGRLRRAGYIFTSSDNLHAMIPGRADITTESDRSSLNLLGILIGMALNTHEWAPGSVQLAVPLPAIFFDALMSSTLSYSVPACQTTALSVEYDKWCGDLSPAECLRDTGLDIVDTFPDIGTVDEHEIGKQAYLDLLTRRLLQSDAMNAISDGFLTAYALDPILDPHEAHRLVVAAPEVTFERFCDHSQVHFGENVSNTSVADAVVKRALSSLFADKRGDDFVELVTGIRGLPLVPGSSTGIRVWVKHCNGIEVHTCFQSIDIPVALTGSSSGLYNELCLALHDFVGHGIDARSYNTW